MTYNKKGLNPNNIMYLVINPRNFEFIFIDSLDKAKKIVREIKEYILYDYKVDKLTLNRPIFVYELIQLYNYGKNVYTNPLIKEKGIDFKENLNPIQFKNYFDKCDIVLMDLDNIDVLYFWEDLFNRQVGVYKKIGYYKLVFDLEYCDI